MELVLASDDGDVLRVKTVGRITPETARGTESPKADHEPLAHLLGPQVYGRRVLVNLAESDYVSSSGVGWLLACHKRCREAGGKLVLYALPRTVQNVLKVLKLDSVLHVADDEAEARRRATE
ncbi:MAG TPA: STAS domain-containing protein [Pirellulales bacterium]|jgi:anti-anti-sigma factor|nr:STAS domain-containing protein [Pirellulales bacterium]